MKIIYILKSLAALAGTERIMTAKINYLAKIGYDIMVVTYEQGEHPIVFDIDKKVIVKDIDCRFFTLMQHKYPQRTFEYLKMRKAFKARLKECVNDFNPDILITTSYSLKVMDIIYKARGRAKCILESHVHLLSELKGGNTKNHIIKNIYSLYDKFTLRYAKRFDKIVTLTKADAETWQRYTKPCVVIPNFIENVNCRQRRHETFRRIISVGRLNQQKGYDLLIQGCRNVLPQYPDWRLDIFGEGTDYAKLSDMINKYNLGKQIHIMQPTKHIFDEYAKSDFYVMSSRHEGFGLVLIEAMSCGLPCVSFDCPHGPADIIDNGKNGILVENGNTDKLATAMELLINDEEKRTTMGQQAQEIVQKYSPDSIMKMWTELFNQLKGL